VRLFIKGCIIKGKGRDTGRILHRIPIAAAARSIELSLRACSASKSSAPYNECIWQGVARTIEAAIGKFRNGTPLAGRSAAGVLVGGKFEFKPSSLITELNGTNRRIRWNATRNISGSGRIHGERKYGATRTRIIAQHAHRQCRGFSLARCLTGRSVSMVITRI
jgi:hypothetical protein